MLWVSRHTCMTCVTTQITCEFFCLLPGCLTRFWFQLFVSLYKCFSFAFEKWSLRLLCIDAECWNHSSGLLLYKECSTNPKIWCLQTYSLLVIGCNSLWGSKLLILTFNSKVSRLRLISLKPNRLLQFKHWWLVSAKHSKSQVNLPEIRHQTLLSLENVLRFL
jgi:hypothetical protein